MSLLGDAMEGLRNVVLMQANLERMDKQLEHLDRTQDVFREALFRLSERLTRVETVLFDPRPPASTRPALPEE